DADRSLDIAYSIGQSKAIRNVIVNALQSFCDFAFDAAKNSLVDKIGRELERWRKQTIEGLGRIPVELARVERVIGRPAKDWLAPQIAQVIAMGRSIADGMAHVDDVFPPPPPLSGEGGAAQAAAGAGSRVSHTDAGGGPDAREPKQ